MKRSPLVGLILGVLVSMGMTTSASADSPFGGQKPRGIKSGVIDRCSTPEPTRFEMDATSLAVQRFIDENSVAATGNIKVAFHVIYNPGTNEGNISQSMIDAQIAKLNSDFAGSGFTFSLASVDRTGNSKWFAMTPGSSRETQAKNALKITPATRLNFYTCKPGQGLLGWATFPWSYSQSDYRHGVVCHYGSVPGGNIPPYNLGRTAVHEVGHYLGLYHTFQGGCTSPGDQVDDTPYEASAAFGCPTGRNTCSQAGNDPITNFMDYTDDACMYQFSAGQKTRMQSYVGTYRPSLLNAAIAQNSPSPAGEPSVTGTVSFRGAHPNPFTASTSLRYALPRAGHVQMSIYNVAGQRVETLVDRDMEAGEHTVEFAAKRLPAGTYFVQMTANGERAARTVILVR